MQLLDTNVKRVDVTRSERCSLYAFGSSHGNQIKWKHDNQFIKLDCLGYEGVAETLVSWLLRFSDLDQQEYIAYDGCRVYEDGKYLGLGCTSPVFGIGYEEVSVASILKKEFMSFAIGYDELREVLIDWLNWDPKSYIDKILCLDAISRNDDRHFGNIVFLQDAGIYKPAPIFDNGGACMSDIITYPMNVGFETNIRSVQAKPFSVNFENQLHNVTPIRIRVDEFLNSVHAQGPYTTRALDTIKYGLEKTEGLAWERM